ncbi:MAG TPA: hypothetical protein VIM79_24135 [Niastella sp.]
MMAIIERTINTELTSICWGQDKLPMIPPQLQGNLSFMLTRVITYIVKIDISASDAYKPDNLQRGRINKTVMRNSTDGISQAIRGATGFNIGEPANCSLKVAWSVNLLMPVYKKSIIRRMEIISTVIEVFILNILGG